MIPPPGAPPFGVASLTLLLATTVHAIAPVGSPRTQLAPRPPQSVIMPLGDSITHGGQGHASFRYPLYFALDELGFATDFVGTETTVYGGDGWDNPDTTLYPDYYRSFDREHEGHWGYRSDEIVPLVIDAAELALPDFALIHLGTNDVGQWGPYGVDNTIANLPRIVDNLRSVRPVIRVLLAQIIPIGPGSGYYANAGQVGPLNDAIAELAANLDRAASPVLLVDQHSGFDLATEMQQDGLHPNPAGEERMAAVWLQSLAPELDIPLPPPHPDIDIANPGFESLDLADGQAVDLPDSIGWSFGVTPGALAGVFNPGADTYLGAAGSGTPAGAEGDEVCYLYNGWGWGEKASIFQTLPTTWEPATRYTATIAVGNRLGGNPYGPSSYGGYRIDLFAGNEIVATTSDQVVPAVGEFADVSVAVSSDSIAAELPGRLMTIRLGLTSDDPVTATDFDNLRLTRQGSARGSRPGRRAPMRARTGYR